jgi:hypothetical protein
MKKKKKNGALGGCGVTSRIWGGGGAGIGEEAREPRRENLINATVREHDWRHTYIINIVRLKNGMKSVRGDDVLSVLVQLGGIAPEGVISEPIENLLQPRVLDQSI